MAQGSASPVSVSAASSLSPLAQAPSQTTGLSPKVAGTPGSLDGPSSDIVSSPDLAAAASTNWWQSQTETGVAALSAGVASFKPAAGGGLSGATGSAVTSVFDAASLQQQLLLRQAVNAFQADAGAAPALWTRSGGADLLSTLAAAAKTPTTAQAKTLVGAG
jgi:hypothetical protein